MKNPASTTMFSIFGQIEEIVAKEMVAEGKMTQLPIVGLAEMSRHLVVSSTGERLKMLVSVPNRNVPEFETRIADLRA